MSEEDKYMDQSFRKMSKDAQSTYHNEFWKEMEKQLDNASMDDAFKSAVEEKMVIPPLPDNLNLDDLGDAFMDDAFKDAAADQSVGYDSSFWEAFSAEREGLEMEEAFSSAAKDTKANYQPQYWMQASAALEEEGLHYEYKKAYWNEAKTLLDKSDRKGFFFKWTGIAAILLLVSGTLFNLGQSLGSLTGISRTDNAFVNKMLLVHESNYKNDELDPGEIASNFEEIDRSEILNLNSERSETINESNEVSEMLHIGQNNERTPDADFNSFVENNDVDLIETSDDLEMALGASSVDDVSSNNEALADITVDREGVTQSARDIDGGVDEDVLNDLPIPLVLDEEEFEFSKNKGELSKLETPLRAIPVNVLTNGFIQLVPIQNLQTSLIHEVSLLGLTGFGNKYNTKGFLAEQRNGLGLNYTLGGLGKRNNLEFEIGGMANRVKMSDLNLQRISVVYDNYGSAKRYWYNVTYQNAFYASGNVLMNYKVGEKHKIALGVGISRLIAVQTNLAELNKDENILITNNNWGISEGFNTIDGKVRVGYEYKLTNNFSARLDGTIGLNDRTDNSYFESGYFDREKTIMIGVKYVMFRGVK